MLFKLSIRNMKKSFKDYAIYFLTLVLGVAIFYMFFEKFRYMTFTNSKKKIREG